MTSKKGNNRKKLVFKNIKFLDPKKIDLSKLKINPTNIVENTKSKIEDYYLNFKKELENNKKKKRYRKNLMRRKN